MSLNGILTFENETLGNRYVYFNEKIATTDISTTTFEGSTEEMVNDISEYFEDSTFWKLIDFGIHTGFNEATKSFMGEVFPYARDSLQIGSSAVGGLTFENWIQGSNSNQWIIWGRRDGDSPCVTVSTVKGVTRKNTLFLPVINPNGIDFQNNIVSEGTSVKGLDIYINSATSITISQYAVYTLNGYEITGFTNSSRINSIPVQFSGSGGIVRLIQRQSASNLKMNHLLTREEVA